MAHTQNFRHPPLEWYEAGLFLIDDALVDSDPFSNLSAIAHGWGRRTLVHPHLANIFSIPIRLVQLSVSVMAPDHDARHLRELLALAVAPLSTTAAALAVFVVARTFTRQQLPALIAMALFSSFFAVTVFASLPEAFSVTGGLLAALFAYVRLIEVKKVSDRFWVWFVFGFLIMSVTITNAISFGIIYLAHLAFGRRLEFVRALKHAAALTVIVGSGVLLTGEAAILALGYSDDAAKAGVTSYVESFVSLSPSSILRNLQNILLTHLQAIVGIGGMERGLKYCANLPHCRALYFSVSQLEAWRVAAAATVAIAITFSYRHAWKAPHMSQPLVAASFGVLVFNHALHSVFGTEMMLFSLHWMIGLFLLFVPLLVANYRVAFMLLATVITVNFSAVSTIPRLTAEVAGQE